MTRVVELIGGTNNGKLVEVVNRQVVIYVQKKISDIERSNLRIDTAIHWREPDEVYEICSDGKFRLARVVNYKPEE